MAEQWMIDAANKIERLLKVADARILSIIHAEYDEMLGKFFEDRPVCGELSCMACDERTAALFVEVERLKALHEPITDTYACYRCGRRDGLDASVPNEIWAKLAQGKLLTVEVIDARWPILCLWCMDDLAAKIGIKCSASLHFAGRGGVYGTSDSDANKEHVLRLVAEVERLRTRLLTAAGDDLCRLSQEEIKAMSAGAVKIPPKEEFLASCERFHTQVANESGVTDNCLTLAQLVAENEKQRAEIERLNSELAKRPMPMTWIPPDE